MAFPEGWRSFIGESSRPITNENGYLHKPYVNDDSEMEIHIETRWYLGEHEFVVRVKPFDRLTPGGEHSAHSMEDRTFSITELGAEEAEEKAQKHARSLMKRLNTGEY
ncbi:MAG: hypothetical protein ABEK59_06400 [Halobacteria archaeon]